MKKQLSIFVVIVLVVTVLLSTPVFAASNDIRVMIVDPGNIQTQVQFAIHPIIENGRTLVEMRPILEALGEEVEWDQETKTITIYSYGGVLNDKDIDKTIMQIGSTKITNEYWMWDDNDYTYKNVLRNNKTMDVAPKVVNGHTMIPVRHIGAGRYVTWYGANRTIYLSSLPMQINGVTIQPEDTRYPEDLAAIAADQARIDAMNKPYSNPEVPEWALDAVNDYLKEYVLRGFAVGVEDNIEENYYIIHEYLNPGDPTIGTFHVDKTTKKVMHIYDPNHWDLGNINDPYNPQNPNNKIPEIDGSYDYDYYY